MDEQWDENEGPTLAQPNLWKQIRSYQPVPVSPRRKSKTNPYMKLAAAINPPRPVDQDRRVARAHRAVADAIEMGTLVRPTECSRCHETPPHKLHGHHEDYDKPLDVIWLCGECHARVHAIKRGSVFQDPTVAA